MHSFLRRESFASDDMTMVTGSAGLDSKVLATGDDGVINDG